MELFEQSNFTELSSKSKKKGGANDSVLFKRTSGVNIFSYYHLRICHQNFDVKLKPRGL